MDRPLLRSALLSLGIHALLMVPIGFTIGITADASTDVIRGINSIELELVSASEAAVLADAAGQTVTRSVSPEESWLDDGGALRHSVPASLRNDPPPYPWMARVNGWQGTVFVRIWVTKRGRVRSLQVTKSSGYPMLDSAAFEAIRRWEFIPARRAGQAVASLVELPITFHLENEKERRDPQ